MGQIGTHLAKIRTLGNFAEKSKYKIQVHGARFPSIPMGSKLKYKYTCMYECRYDYKCTDSAKYRCNCTRRHYLLHCLVPVLGLDWSPIEPDFTYHTLQHTYVHDSSVGLRMFLGVI